MLVQDDDVGVRPCRPVIALVGNEPLLFSKNDDGSNEEHPEQKDRYDAERFEKNSLIFAEGSYITGQRRYVSLQGVTIDKMVEMVGRTGRTVDVKVKAARAGRDKLDARKHKKPRTKQRKTVARRRSKVV